MASKIFVNLPVKDLQRSVTYFTKLGYTFNPHFTDENATCMIVGDDIFVMLLVEPYFGSFIPGRKVSDAKAATEVLVALSCDSKADVQRIAETALANGGTAVRDVDDKGFMFTWAVADPDGHIWEYFWMDPKAIPA